MMKPANHIFLFRSIINYYNIKKNSLLLTKLQQQIPLPITFDIYGRAIYEINSEDGLMKKSSSENVEDCSSENQGPLSDEESYISSYESSLSNREPFSYTPDNLTHHFDAATDELWPVAYSLRMTIGDKRQIMDRCSLNVNIISLAMRLLSYLNHQVICWNDLLNVGTSDLWKYLNDKKFVQILPLNERHYVVITSLELSTEETNTIYIFDPCIEFSYPEVDNDKKYPIYFIKTCCNILPKTQRKISFKLMHVYQANSLSSSGYYIIMYAYTLFHNLDIFSIKVPQENISSTIISFFETNEIQSFQCLRLLHETKPDVYIDFQEKLYCHCRGPYWGNV